ncbi:hypothetical protein EJ05DRAFT_479024 [Pseudovirgaria hyperparasitica]|uniref:Uncharacterized protein n=1 Tax=Pseudovirgaria hyperparasitica TaxID=470096 RepID=A0A6A6W2I0_9PEZI|nr:uncharacterized protein EJ05DRAFT_479024 [Pseudovirgaria hyperparasitica]KAF2755231.1 hypothetical protein EJ05DRAFT_479024 [Pseudovirgaria hyperparasitica]
MSTNRSSGVRNLRAIFEQTSDVTTSPEPRGRSPAASITSDTSLSRPTSKIRASFVSVESSGFFPRETSAARSTSRHYDATSPLAQRRESFSLRQSRDIAQIEELKKTMSNEIEQRKMSVDMGVVDEVVPESAIGSGSTATPILEPTDKTVGAIDTQPPETAPHSTAAIEAEALPTSPDAPTTEPLTEKTNSSGPATEVEAPLINPDKPNSVKEETPAVTKPSDSTDTPAVSAGEASRATQEPVEQVTKSTSSTVPDATVEPPTAKPKADDTPAAAPAPVAEPEKKPEKKPEPAKSNGGSSIIAEAKAKLKATTTSKPAPIQTKATSVKPAVKSPTKTPTSATSKTAPVKPAPSTSKAPRASMSSSTSSSAKERLSGSTSTGSFVKPKPKSPTRPVQLPSHLTQPTASSAAKHEAEASVARKPAGRDRTSSFKPPAPVKKAPRASLPPQPSSRSESRTSTAAPDSGFLARMMRPTASSASKTHEKVEVKSPPRRAPAPAPASSKPKSGTGASTASKVKAKVDEGVSKVKEAVTSNGNGVHEESATNSKEGNTTENTGEATPDVTSNDLTAETPNFEGATIR